MATVIAEIRLAPGEVGYYDNYSRIYLSTSRPTANIYADTNTTQIRKSIRSGRLRLVSGSLNLTAEQPKAKEPVKKPEKPVAKAKAEPVPEPVAEEKAEPVIEEPIEEVVAEPAPEEPASEEPAEEPVVKPKRRSRKKQAAE